MEFGEQQSGPNLCILVYKYNSDRENAAIYNIYPIRYDLVVGCYTKNKIYYYL